MKVLVTGFAPFDGQLLNPSWEAVKYLPKRLGNLSIQTLEIPTVFGQSAQFLETAIREQSPDVVLCVGQAGGRSELTLERVAINIADAPIPDNAGQQPIDEPIREDGASAYFSTLPIKAMVAALREAGVPASVSNTAGTYVCNYLMYQTLYLADKVFPKLKAGFIHLPYMTEQVENGAFPSLPLEEMVRGLTLALSVLETGSRESSIVGGQLH